MKTLMELIYAYAEATTPPVMDDASDLRAEIERRVTETRKLLADTLGEDCLPVRILDGRA